MGPGESAPRLRAPPRPQACPHAGGDSQRCGVTGTLYFTLSVDEGCVLHTLLLPGLDDGGAFLVDRCQFDVSPQGTS